MLVMNRTPWVKFHNVLFLASMGFGLLVYPSGQGQEKDRIIVSGDSTNPIPALIIQLTNQERTRRGLRPLTKNGSLTSAAMLHVGNMVKQNKMEHILDGKRVGDRLDFVGYQYQLCGENIAQGHRTAQAVVQAWMKSPGHRANILKPGYTEIGVATEVHPRTKEPFYCQVFGTP